jgi:hypothetical protein
MVQTYLDGSYPPETGSYKMPIFCGLTSGLNSPLFKRSILKRFIGVFLIFEFQKVHTKKSQHARNSR